MNTMHSVRIALRQASASSAGVLAPSRRVAIPRQSRDLSKTLISSRSVFSPVSSRCLSSSSKARQETTDKAEEASKLSEKTHDAVYGADKKAGDQAAASSDGNSAELEKLQSTLKEKDARIKELADAVLYGKADLQNAQRRAIEDKAAATDYAITRLARDLTSTLDILDLALKSVPEGLRTKAQNASDPEDPRKVVYELFSGVDMTRKSLFDQLKMHGITAFDPTGEKFDPSSMEAMYQAPVPGKEPGSVLECSKIGYKIKNRVLRAAQVGVVQES